MEDVSITPYLYHPPPFSVKVTPAGREDPATRSSPSSGRKGKEKATFPLFFCGRD
jgi:hypothetical protein